MNGLIFTVLLFVAPSSFTVPRFGRYRRSSLHWKTSPYPRAEQCHAALGPIFFLIVIRAGMNVGSVHTFIGI